MHLLLLRALETRGCQIPVDEAQTSYGLSVLPDEEDRMRSSCPTRNPMQVRFISFLDRPSHIPASHRTNQPHHDALCPAVHRS
jgi:hypothetical protein